MGDSRLSVVMATPRFAPEVGGVENHVLELARRLPGNGVDVVVVTSDSGHELSPRDVIEGVPVIRVRAWPRGRDLRVARGLPAAIRGVSADLVHVQSYHTMIGPVAMATALRPKQPYVVTFHGGGHSSSIRSRIRPAQIIALRYLLRRSDSLIATARFEIEHYGRLLGLGPEHFVYLPNGAELPALTQSAKVDPHLIVSLGRLERYKGHHRAIEALPHVLADDPRAHLWIAGSGPYEPKLRALAIRLGVADRVEIRAVPGAERARYAKEVAGARLAVLLSDFETHPLAAIEAAGLGVPLVVTEGSGLTELVRDGLAVGIPSSADARAVARAIVSALRTPRRPRVTKLPTWDDCAGDLADLYRAIVRTPACAS